VQVDLLARVLGYDSALCWSLPRDRGPAVRLCPL